jgi:hypothetical protein
VATLREETLRENEVATREAQDTARTAIGAHLLSTGLLGRIVRTQGRDVAWFFARQRHQDPPARPPGVTLAGFGATRRAHAATH